MGNDHLDPIRAATPGSSHGHQRQGELGIYCELGTAPHHLPPRIAQRITQPQFPKTIRDGNTSPKTSYAQQDDGVFSLV